MSVAKKFQDGMVTVEFGRVDNMLMRCVWIAYEARSFGDVVEMNISGAGLRLSFVVAEGSRKGDALSRIEAIWHAPSSEVLDWIAPAPATEPPVLPLNITAPGDARPARPSRRSRTGRIRAPHALQRTERP